MPLIPRAHAENVAGQPADAPWKVFQKRDQHPCPAGNFYQEAEREEEDTRE